MRVEELPDLAAGEGHASAWCRHRAAPASHQVRRTSITPTTSLASSENVAGDRSITRPGLCASRSSTMHRTERPGPETSVTVTTVPKARVGLAQVPAGAPYHEARPVVACTADRRGGVRTAFERAPELWCRVHRHGCRRRRLGTGDVVGGGAAVVVVVGTTGRNETLTTRVSASPDADGVGPVTGAHRGATRVDEPTKSTGVVHDVDRRRQRLVAATTSGTGVVPRVVQRGALRCGKQEERHDHQGETTPQLHTVPQPPGAAGPQISTLPLRTPCQLRQLRRDHT